MATQSTYSTVSTTEADAANILAWYKSSKYVAPMDVPSGPVSGDIELPKPTPSVRLLKEGEMPKKAPKYPGLAKFMADHKIRVEGFSLAGETKPGMTYLTYRLGILVDGKRTFTTIRSWTHAPCPTETFFDIVANYGVTAFGNNKAMFKAFSNTPPL